MRFVFRIFYDAIMHFSQDDGWAIASHIALSILTSMFPFLIFVTALASFIGTKSLADEVHELVHILLQTWPPQVAAPIANEIHNVLTHSRSGLLTISVILAIYFSSSGVEAVRIGLNRAYDVRDSRPWWLMRLESIAYIFVGAFALLTLAFLVVLAPLIWVAMLHFAPGLEPLSRAVKDQCTMPNGGRRLSRPSLLRDVLGYPHVDAGGDRRLTCRRVPKGPRAARTTLSPTS